MHEEVKIMSEKDIIKFLQDAPHGTTTMIARAIKSPPFYIFGIKNEKVRPGIKILMKLSDYISKNFAKE